MANGLARLKSAARRHTERRLAMKVNGVSNAAVDSASLPTATRALLGQC
jgi:hypothetical protein